MSERHVYTCDCCGAEEVHPTVTVQSTDNRLHGPTFPRHYCTFFCAARDMRTLSATRPVEAALAEGGGHQCRCQSRDKSMNCTTSADCNEPFSTGDVSQWGRKSVMGYEQ